MPPKHDPEVILMELEAVVVDEIDLKTTAEDMGLTTRRLVALFDRVQDEELAPLWEQYRAKHLPKKKRSAKNAAPRKKRRSARKLKMDRAHAIKLIVLDGWTEEAVMEKFKITRRILLTWGEKSPPHLVEGWGAHLAKMDKIHAEQERGKQRVARKRNQKRSNPRPPDPEREEKKKIFLQELRSGKSIEMAALAAGVTTWYGRKWRREAGITKTQPPGSPSDPIYETALRKLARGYHTLDEVAEEFELVSETLRKKCNKRGIKFRRKNSTPLKPVSRTYTVWPQATRQRLVEMVREEGKDISEAAELLNVPNTTARGWCKADGIKRPRNCPQRNPRWLEGVERVASGEHPDDVSADLGCSTARLKEWCAEQGVTWVYRDQIRERHPKRDEAVRLMIAGMSCGKAALWANVSKPTAQRWFHEDTGRPLSDLDRTFDLSRTRHPQRDQVVKMMIDGKLAKEAVEEAQADVSPQSAGMWFLQDVGMRLRDFRKQQRRSTTT